LIAALALAVGACGDDDSESSGPTEEDAVQVVNEAIAAFGDEDYERLCELSDERINSTIANLMDKPTCAEGYAKLVPSDDQFTDFVAKLQTYEAGEAKLVEGGAEVELVSTQGGEPAKSFVIIEDGAFKVNELFVTPEAGQQPAPGEVPPGGEPAPGG